MDNHPIFASIVLICILWIVRPPFLLIAAALLVWVPIALLPPYGVMYFPCAVLSPALGYVIRFKVEHEFLVDYLRTKDACAGRPLQEILSSQSGTRYQRKATIIVLVLVWLAMSVMVGVIALMGAYNFPWMKAVVGSRFNPLVGAEIYVICLTFSYLLLEDLARDNQELIDRIDNELERTTPGVWALALSHKLAMCFGARISTWMTIFLIYAPRVCARVWRQIINSWKW